MTHGLDVIYDIDDFVQRFNALRARQHRRLRLPGEPEAYTRWQVRGILEAAKVEFLPRQPRGKIRFTHQALADALGGELLNSLLDVETLTAGPGDAHP